jgi:hypothetical protein
MQEVGSQDKREGIFEELRLIKCRDLTEVFD